MKPAVPLNEGTLAELVRRIVEAVHPRKILLFGSAARGQVGLQSDLDVLVIMPDGIHRRDTARQISRALLRLGVPTDVVVATEGDVRRYAAEDSLVLCPALREGMEIYHAA